MSNLQYNVTNWQEAVIAAGGSVVVQLLSFLPNLLGSILIFLIGWIIAGWAKVIVAKLLSAAKLQKAIQGSAVEKFLKKADMYGKVEDIIGAIVKWVVALIFFIAAVNILGLSTVSLVLSGILAYIPKVFSATLILLVGILLAGLVESLVKGAAGAFNLATSRLLGKLASWLVMIFSVLAAVSELGIAAQFINTIVIGAVSAISLGLGLAIGLGSKDVVSQILKEWYKKVRQDISRE